MPEIEAMEVEKKGERDMSSRVKMLDLELQKLWLRSFYAGFIFCEVSWEAGEDGTCLGR